MAVTRARAVTGHTRGKNAYELPVTPGSRPPCPQVHHSARAHSQALVNASNRQTSSQHVLSVCHPGTIDIDQLAASRMNGVNVTPTSSPSGSRKRLTV